MMGLRWTCTPAVVFRKDHSAEEPAIVTAVIAVAELIEVVVSVAVVVVAASAVENVFAANAAAATVVCARLERLRLLLQAEFAALHGGTAGRAQALGHAARRHCEPLRKLASSLLQEHAMFSGELSDG